MSAAVKPVVRSFRDLLVWQAAMDLLVAVYGVTTQLPAAERFGLSAQLRRAAVSIPSNIAEGHCRDHRGDYLRQLSVAKGSVGEVMTQLDAATRLGYINPDTASACLASAEQVSRMLHGLTRSLSTPRARET